MGATVHNSGIFVGHAGTGTMTTATMATYAYGQIDQARTELNAGSK